MKRKEKVSYTYIAVDGTEFDSYENCAIYEMFLAKSKIGESSKYIVGHILSDGIARMAKLKFKQYKNGNSRWFNKGYTYNVRYATKFNSFEEAYRVGGTSVITLEEAQRGTEIHLRSIENAKKINQRYVCEFTVNPTEDGEYITCLGTIHFSVKKGWSTKPTVPVYWMRKVSPSPKYGKAKR